MHIRRVTDDGGVVSYRSEGLLIDLQHAVLGGEITREQAIEEARFGLPGIYQDALDEWFPRIGGEDTSAPSAGEAPDYHLRRGAIHGRRRHRLGSVPVGARRAKPHARGRLLFRGQGARIQAEQLCRQLNVAEVAR